jgi:hypothetical protein
MRSRLVLTLALAAAVPLGGCHGGSKSGQVAPATAGVTVEVRNQNFADMDVYVVSEGLATRLGTATGHSTTTFGLDGSFFPSSDLRIVATPIGGNGRASSGIVQISPGQTLEFTIAPLLRASSVLIR